MPVIYGLLISSRSLGIRCLSWAFYHTFPSVKQEVDKQAGKTSFLDILSVLANDFYDISRINWESSKIEVWEGYLNAINEKESEDRQRDSPGEWMIVESQLTSLTVNSLRDDLEPALCI